MRILIVSQYFWPEAFIINDVVYALSQEGHKVTVATGKPNYPHGEIFAGYKKSGVVHERFAEGVEVIRVPLHPRGKAGAMGLSLNYLSFLLSGIFHFPRLLRGQVFDTVLFFGPSPMTSAIPAILLGRLKKAHTALWIQDLWPESLSATGLVKNCFILACVGSVMRAVYSQADTLLLQSQAFADPVSKYADRQKFFYFPNPAPMKEEGSDTLARDLLAHFENCFSVVFAGNLGRAQALETIVTAAILLKDRSDIRFVIVGAGSEAQHLQQLVDRHHLDNIVLTGLVDRALMPAIFRRASALLVTLKDEPAFNMVVPSKIQAYMQAGRPIIGALNGEGARLIKETDCGLAVPAEDGDALAKSILTLASMPGNRLKEMGIAGRCYFENYFEIRSTAIRLINIIEARTGSKNSD